MVHGRHVSWTQNREPRVKVQGARGHRPKVGMWAKGWRVGQRPPCGPKAAAWAKGRRVGQTPPWAKGHWLGASSAGARGAGPWGMGKNPRAKAIG